MAASQGILLTISLKSWKFAFLLISGLTFHLAHILYSCELHLHMTLQPRLPPGLTSPVSSLVLVTVMSSIASPVVGLSIYYLA